MKYDIYGTAFGGDEIQETVESNLNFKDFVRFDVNSLCGTIEQNSFANGNFYGKINTLYSLEYLKLNYGVEVSFNKSKTKAYVDGLERLYIITEIGNENE